MYIKMAKQDLSEKLEFPEGVAVRRESDYFVFEGPKGNMRRKFLHPKISLKIDKNAILLKAPNASKKEKAVINAYRAHILNAYKGVQDNFTYKLKICSGHFPMNVAVSGTELVIKNFLGEKVPRKVKIKEGAKVKVNGSEITVEGPDKELCGQVAADIEQATRRPGFDKRIFQDGIYIIEKAGKAI